MADKTAIEWTDATWNPITGCSVVSAGCKHCYAMKLAGGRLKHHPTRVGLTVDTPAGPVWNGQVRLNWTQLALPSRWTRPRKIFVCAHSDLFHEAIEDEWIDMVFAVMAANPQHTFQVLTKRPARMRTYLADHFRLDKVYAAWPAVSGRAAEVQAWPLPNVWVGVSVEHQEAANERIPHLLATPAARKWISAEPLLGSVDLDYDGRMHELDWVVAGGESGPGARPMHPKWVRQIRGQCEANVVPFLFKQWGNWLGGDQPEAAVYAGTDETSHDWPDGTFSLHVSKKAAGRRLDGQLHDGYPV